MTHYGSRAERWTAVHWPGIRARGCWRFVLVRGIATWGGLMFLAMAAMTAYRLGLHHPRLPLVVALALPLCLIGGSLWAWVTWHINERIYRVLSTAKHIP